MFFCSKGFHRLATSQKGKASNRKNQCLEHLHAFLRKPSKYGIFVLYMSDGVRSDYFLENNHAAAQQSQQLLYSAEVAEMMKSRARDMQPLAFVRTYGCQQNVADGEKIKGMLAEMGFAFTQDENQADFIIFNTCAIREHAEDRVYGNIGALKHVKQRNPAVIIAVCGCMTEQELAAQRIRKSFPFVNIVFGTHVLHRLPEMIHTTLLESKRVFLRGEEAQEVFEGLPVRRDGTSRAWLTVMYGCDNYCSYCIVPFVRGREKSRKPQHIYDEFVSLVEAGYKEITLLGQNVNSYGKGLAEEINFSGLLKMLDSVDGDYRLRFMTSHPKDATPELFDTIASSRHIPHFIHLPVQCGNNRVLKAMNRKYDREKYLFLVNYAKKVMPDISITSDIIVGFPGETYEEFCDTLSLVKEVEYTSLFTFIFSARTGTAAAKLADPAPYAEKSRWFTQLLEVQENIARRRCAKIVGQTFRVLVEDRNEKNGMLSGRTDGSVIVEFPGEDSLIGEFVDVTITKARNWILCGEQK